MSRLSRHSLSIVLAGAVSLLLLAACGLRPMGSDAGDARKNATEGVFKDSFVIGQAGSWQLESDDQAAVAIANEQLVITVAVPNTVQYSTLADVSFEDFILEVDTWQRSGPPEGSYGILFRMQENGQFLRFEVTGNGMYVVERHNVDGSWTRLMPDWAPTSALNQGLNELNRLKIIASGTNLTFYSNDILLGQLIDEHPARGAIALDAGTFGGNNLQVSFDNLVITPGP